MDDRQIQMSLAFRRVTFQIGSYNKRFCQSMLFFAQSKPEHELTERQAANLERMYHMYRRQIPGHEKLCSVCGKPTIQNRKDNDAKKHELHADH